MINIIRVELKRLAHSKLFYITIAVSLLINYCICLSGTDYNDFDINGSLGLFSGLYGVIGAPMTAMLIGEDFSCGTIRNKLIYGNTRTEVYITETIVCSLAGIFIRTLMFAETFLYLYLKNIHIAADAGEMAKVITVCYIAVMVYTALLVMAAMLICEKTSTVIWSELMMILLMLSSGFVLDKKYDDKWQDNKAVLLLNSILPYSQTADMIGEESFEGGSEGSKILFSADENAVGTIIGGSITVMITTAAGAYFFRKKILK